MANYPSRRLPEKLPLVFPPCFRTGNRPSSAPSSWPQSLRGRISARSANFLDKPPEEPPGQVREHNAPRAARMASAHCLFLACAPSANHFEPCARPGLEPRVRCRREARCYESSCCPPLRARSNLRRCSHCFPVGGSDAAQSAPAQSPLFRDGHDRRTAALTRSLFLGGG